MKVDGNKPGNFPVRNENNAYQDQEPLRLKYAAQILAGIASRGGPAHELYDKVTPLAALEALKVADALIAQHNKDQEKKERE